MPFSVGFCQKSLVLKKKDSGVNKKYTPWQYLCRRNVIKTINVIYKYGIESNQQARVDCEDHQSGT